MIAKCKKFLSPTPPKEDFEFEDLFSWILAVLELRGAASRHRGP